MLWGLMSRWMMPRLWAWPRALHDLGDEVQGLPPVQLAPLLLHILLEGDAVDELHDDIVQLAGAGHVVHRHDVGVGEHGDGLGLVVEAAAELRVLRQLLLEDLDGHQTVEPVAPGLVDHGHAAGADALQDLISVVEQFSYVLIHTFISPFLQLLHQDCRHVVRRAAGFWKYAAADPDRCPDRRRGRSQRAFPGR